MINELESKTYLFEKDKAIRHTKFKLRTLTGILNKVSEITGIPVVHLKSKSRERALVDARSVYYQIARKNTPYTTKEIGMYVNRNHATVLYGLRQEYKEVRDILNKIK